MDTTPTWIPLATAGAALIGGGVGAMLQGTFSVNSWRRQTRYEAYTAFINASHQYHNSLGNYLQAHARRAPAETLDEEFARTRKASLLIGEAGSLVIVAGPASMEKKAEPVGRLSMRIARELQDNSTLEAAAAAARRSEAFDTLELWQEAIGDFQTAARRILKTEGVFGRLSLRR